MQPPGWWRAKILIEGRDSMKPRECNTRKSGRFFFQSGFILIGLQLCQSVIPELIGKSKHLTASPITSFRWAGLLNGQGFCCKQAFYYNWTLHSKGCKDYSHQLMKRASVHAVFLMQCPNYYGFLIIIWSIRILLGINVTPHNHLTRV